jgi:hypothetical protein
LLTLTMPRRHLQLTRLSRLHWAVAASAVAVLLAACGGSSGSGNSSADTGSTASAVTTFSAAPTLSGVAAVGAPLTGAALRVLDATGAVVGSTTTHASDGSYSLTLSSKTLTGPLLLQVRGLDAAGNNQVLHSAVPVLSAASAAIVANVTPLSDAVVALSLGADPQPVFAAASQSAAAIAHVATAASGAAEFVKTLVKTQLTDLKMTDPKALDLLADAGFAANKGAQDLLLESLRVNLALSSKGVLQLQLSNKLQVGSSAEVIVDLPMAQTELLKTTSPAPANAITSTLKFTSSPTATLANLGSLDELSAALNKLIAQGSSASTLLSSALLTGYDTHNGRLKADVATRLADYAAKNRQLGRWLVTGCADDVVTGGLCNRVLVSAPVSDSTGVVVGQYQDAVSYTKASVTGSKWNLIGNGKKLELAVYPLAFLALAADATPSTALSPNPGVGIQTYIQAQSDAAVPVKLLSSATLQTPGGFSIPFANCGQVQLCISSTAGATTLVPTGGIADTALQRAAVGWIGGADSVRGAKYIASYTLAGVVETRSVYLRAEVPADLPRARFPALDGVSTSKPLRSGELLVGMTLNWAAWAAANPDMRLISLRTVLSAASDGSSTPLITELMPPLPPSTTLDIAGLTLASGFVPLSYELWLGAQDAAGRRYFTRYTLMP